MTLMREPDTAPGCKIGRALGVLDVGILFHADANQIAAERLGNIETWPNIP